VQAASVGRSRKRAIAILIAAAVFVAQLLALSHVHQQPTRVKQLSESITLSANDGLCALCLLHFHAQTVTDSPLSFFRPFLPVFVGPAGERLHYSVPLGSSIFGRAPPLLPG
jgi:hypothetical protein